MKKIKIFLFGVLCISSLFLFQESKAITGFSNAEELKALILSLQLQIEQLQKQLNQIEKPGSASWCHNFNTNLKYGDKGSEVEALQLVLEKEGFKITDSEKNPSANFGEFTASAVVGFQEKYNKEILAPLGLERGTGFFGKATREKLNKIYGCAASSIFLNPILPVSTSSLTNTQLPDLTVTDIRFAEKPFSWSSDNFIFAKVCNYSSQNLQIENPEVSLEVDGIYAGLFNGSKSLLGAGKCVEAHFSTFYPLAIKTGSHSVVATADPSNKIPESNENNNKLAKQIFIISVDSSVSMPQQSGYDKCSFGGGFSLPESSANKCGWPVGSSGAIKDCCCCYLTSHIHDLGGTFSNKQVLIEYMPGLYQGCSSPMTVYSSLDGVSWNTVLTTNVKQETWTPKTTYNKTINVSGQFRYIKIYIPSCYNDYSSAKVLGDITEAAPSITVLYPNGGETLIAGQTYPIKWKASGISKVSIAECAETPLLTTKYTCHELSGIPITGIDASLGFFNWHIDPNDPFISPYIPSSLKIRISDKNSSLYDESDNYFKIPAYATITPVLIEANSNTGVRGQTIDLSISGQNLTGANNYSGCGISPVSDRGFNLVSCNQISDTLIHAQFLISDTAEPGTRNITIQTPTGLSNPLVFWVVTGESGIKSIENQLADISAKIYELMKYITLMKK